MKKASILISMVLCALVTVAVISQFCVQPVAAGAFHYRLRLTVHGNHHLKITGDLTSDGIPVYHFSLEQVGDGTVYDPVDWPLHWIQTEWKVNDWEFDFWLDCNMDGVPEETGHVKEGGFVVPPLPDEHIWPKDCPAPDPPPPPPDVILGIAAPGPVGGIVIPIDKLALLAPYIGFASTVLVATAATAIYVKRVKRRKEKQ